MVGGVVAMCALLAVVGPVQGPTVRVSVAGPAKAAPGTTITLNVVLQIPEGYHVQAHTVPPPNIPTSVLLKLPRGFKAGKPVFPHPARGEAGGQTLDLFEGRVVVRVPVTIPKSARGPAAITAEVTYQACDATSCYPPAEASVTHKITVARTQ